MRFSSFVDKRSTELAFKCEILHVAKSVAGAGLFARYNSLINDKNFVYMQAFVKAILAGARTYCQSFYWDFRVIAR